MELLMVLLMAMLFLVKFIDNGYTTKPLHVDMIDMYSDVDDQVVNHYAISEYIKLDILTIFQDNDCSNRRDLIVNKLRELTCYEDPGDFLEKFNFIHDYIFNYYMYDNWKNFKKRGNYTWQAN